MSLNKMNLVDFFWKMRGVLLSFFPNLMNQIIKICKNNYKFKKFNWKKSLSNKKKGLKVLIKNKI